MTVPPGATRGKGCACHDQNPIPLQTAAAQIGVGAATVISGNSEALP